MGQDSKIEWTHATFNPWRGCTKVSDGCKNCYAETLSARNPKVLGMWGPKGARVIASEKYWQEPLKWNREAEQSGERRRVFCASLADVFEGPDTMPQESRQPVSLARLRLFRLIMETPHLDWLLLTKRPENVMLLLAQAMNQAWGIPQKESPFACWLEAWVMGKPPKNVWLGTSTEDQKTYDQRVLYLRACPAIVRFLSVEPFIGPIDPTPPEYRGTNTNLDDWLQDLGLIIVGGESGSEARPMHPNWVRTLRDRCVNRTDMGRPWPLPFFFKQWGEWGYNCFLPQVTAKQHADGKTFDFEGMDRGTLGVLEMVKVGKKSAGRMLDGRFWDELPQLGERVK